MAQAFDRDFSEVLALLQANRLSEARTAASALVAAHPNAAAHNILGVIQATGGDPAAAASFRKAIERDARWDEPHTNLGLLLCRQKDFERAIDSFRAALTLKPSNTAAAINLGNALRELGRSEEALASYRGALARGGAEQPLAHNNIGAILLDQGKVEEASAAFARAIALQPGFADAHLNQGRASRALGRFEHALESLRRAADITPQSAETAVTLANTYRDLGRHADAAEGYRRALALKPDDREAAYNLGLALNALGRHGEGLAAIASGPGIARLSTRAPGNAAARRMTIGAGTTFIGAWSLQDPSLCEALIGYFETQGAAQSPGRTGLGIDTAVKNSTDLTVMPADLGKPALAPVAAYLKELEACIGDYAVQWPHFGGMLNQVDLVPFTLQRYTAGGHFQKPHAERMAFGFMHRLLAWMTYLNDVPEGGATTFHHYGIQVKPERGKTLIWPAEWTHVHAGEIVPSGTKYIITGWMHFPHSE